MVWETVEAVTENGVRGDWNYHVFLTLSVTLAAIAVKLDSAIMVIAAMVVSPDFSPVAAICVGIVCRGRRDLIRRGLSLLASGFAFSILAVTVLAFFAVWAGWIGLADLLAPRPQTGFIWAPDRWSFVVALLAGAAGALSLTSSRSNALVGVFIAVTTVPAAGALSFALAVGLYETLSEHGATVFALHGRLVHELTGSALQLVINLVGMVLAGIAALWVTQGFDERTTRRGRDPVVP